MKLLKVRIQHFRNILDSTEVVIQPDVTCLVGKNESGKTAFLQALYRLKPARGNALLSAPDQYPAWLEKRDRMSGKNLEEFIPVTATFGLEVGDREPIEVRFGPKVVASETLVVGRSYGGKYKLPAGSPFSEPEAVRHVASTVKSHKHIQKDVKAVSTFAELVTYAAGLKAKGAEHPEDVAAGAELEAAVASALGGKAFFEVAWALIEPRIPKLFYFADFAKLPYSVKIRELLSADEKTLGDDLFTAKSLLKQAAAEDEYLLNPDYERRKRELENVANAITSDVNQFWTQNDRLRVMPDITMRAEARPQGGQQTVVDELKIRIWDDRHGLSLPFNEHSTGFQWFFSFLAAFSEFEFLDVPVIVLLDEPALGLHARAQADFLRFIDERLAKRCQVLFTTHSPFMVQPGRLERVRMVEDKGRELGTVVTQEILSTDRDTLFPLQGALGYDLVQHLFINEHNLLVEGTSDYTYLSIMSDFLRQAGRKALDERWTIVPVGSADMIPTFVALLGTHLKVTVLVDSRKEGHQRLSKLAEGGYLKEKRIVTIGQSIGKKLGDIEDLFEPTEYLDFFNDAYSAKVTPSELQGTDPMVQKLARHLGQPRFDHGRPADSFLRRRDVFLPKLSTSTLQRFEALFVRLNETLGL